jgi:hypothetical protein
MFPDYSHVREPLPFMGATDRQVVQEDMRLWVYHVKWIR